MDAEANAPAIAYRIRSLFAFALSSNRSASAIMPCASDTTTITTPWVLPRKSSITPFRRPVTVPAPFLFVMPIARTIQSTCRPARNCPAPKGTPTMWLTMFPR